MLRQRREEERTRKGIQTRGAWVASDQEAELLRSQTRGGRAHLLSGKGLQSPQRRTHLSFGLKQTAHADWMVDSVKEAWTEFSTHTEPAWVNVDSFFPRLVQFFIINIKIL